MQKNVNKRLNNIILRDKNDNIVFMNNLLKSDIFYLLNNYFDIIFDDILCEIKNDNDGYHLRVEMCAKHTKFPHKRLS